MLRIKTSTIDPSTGEPKTVGEKVGLKVRVVWKDTRNKPPGVEKDIDETLAAKVDGSGRRVILETSGWLATIGRSFDGIGDIVAKYLF